MFSKLFDSFLVHYLERFNDHCFTVKVEIMNIQSVTENPSLPSSLIAIFPKGFVNIRRNSPSVKRTCVKISKLKGDLFKALCVVLGHVGKDSINRQGT